MQLSLLILTLAMFLTPYYQEKGVRIQEGSLCAMPYALGVPSWVAFGFATLTGEVWAPFSGVIPSFQFKWVANLDVFTSGDLQIKCSVLLQW